MVELANNTCLATGKMQLCNADDGGISQQTRMVKTHEGNVTNVT